jgi:hypothetical protein
MINRTKLQLLLALFWFVSAYLAAGALLPWEWAWRCAWLNLIIGMVGLLVVTWTKFGERMFYEGPKGDEDGMHVAGRRLMGCACGYIIPGDELVDCALAGIV